MAKLRGALRFLSSVTSHIVHIVQMLIRLAKRLAAPGAGPKLVAG